LKRKLSGILVLTITFCSLGIQGVYGFSDPGVNATKNLSPSWRVQVTHAPLVESPALTAASRATAPASQASQNSKRLRRLAAAQARIQAKRSKDGLDSTLRGRADKGGFSRVIVELCAGSESSETAVEALGGKMGRRLRSFNGQVVELSNKQIRKLAKNPAVCGLHHDRSLETLNSRTAITVGARAAQLAYGYTGAGVGVAVIDSGITSWHDDLTSDGTRTYPYGNQRVAAFVDLVSNRSTPYDDNGHGTHVAGTIAGNGYDSYGYKAGMAPGAHLIVLKVLDENGQGTISNIIAALDYVVAHKSDFNIRVVNLSIGAGVYESYDTDPLTLAAKRAVDAGIVVVAAAGNLGNTATGGNQYGGITAPGNAPWVITVSASTTMGTVNRTDDLHADYSSRGPTFIDYTAKPDLVAPGTGTFSLADPTSMFFATKATHLQFGYRETSSAPYLALSGTSMSAPVVSGSVALMMEANPALTPNLVKAILQYTAEVQSDYDALTQGAGFLNTMGAVELARSFASREPGTPYPNNEYWSHHLIWGNHLIEHGVLLPHANAWSDNVVWGSAFDGNGDNVVWGSSGDQFDNIVWGSSDADNIVWGSSGEDNIVWGSSGEDNIVWGSSDADNIVWGSDCGGADCDNIVWGSSGLGDNIVWGSGAAETADNIVWGSSGDPDNIVWGSGSLDNVVWGSSDDDNIVWGSSSSEVNAVWPDEIDFVMADPTLWHNLFVPPGSASGPVVVEDSILTTAITSTTTEPVATTTETTSTTTEPVATTTTETTSTTTAPVTSTLETTATTTESSTTTTVVGGGL
jgi:serine protease AprX